MAEQKLDVKISTTADVSGANQATKALDGVAAAGSRVGKGGAAWLNSTRESAGKAVNALGELKKGTESVSKVFNGLSQATSGSLLSRLSGLAGAARGMGEILKSLASSGILRAVAAFGGLAAAVAVVGKVFLDTRKAIIDARDGVHLASKSADEYKKELEEIGKTSTATLEKHLADIKKVSDAYSELIGRMDEAEKRAAKRNELNTNLALTKANLDEKKALAGAKTEDEREKISARFEQERKSIAEVAQNAELENRVFAAKTRSDSATVAISEATGTIDSAKVQATLATRDREVADENARTALEGIRGAQTPLEKRRAAIAATEALRSRSTAQAAETAALDNVKTVTIEAERVINQAQDETTAAQNTIEDTSVEKQTISTQRAADKINVTPIQNLSAPTTERTDSLRAQLKAAEDAQFADRTFGGNARLNDNVSMLKAAYAESAEADAKQLSVFTAQVQAQVASRKKMAREMEKVSTRANDNRP